MGTYVLLSTLTPSGGSTLHTHPHRLKEVNREITEFGCRVISQYALLGPYDFLTIVEAPDDETIAHLSVDLGSRRHGQGHEHAGHDDRLAGRQAAEPGADGQGVARRRSGAPFGDDGQRP